MKSVMIIIDGLGDEPIVELGKKTPLESAIVPNMDYIASNGCLGSIDTVFEGYPIESMVCIMGLLGYDPVNYYPNGRASFEAMAKGIPLGRNDLILRCNIINVDLEKQSIKDFTAGMISDSNAKEIISKIRLPSSKWELYPGQSYRNILIIRDAMIDVGSITCFPPHMHVGQSIQDIMPRSHIFSTQQLLDEIISFLVDTQNQIFNMNLPKNCDGNMLWVWSPSHKPEWPSFFSKTHQKAALVGELDFLHGMAMAADIHFDLIPGATGYRDTDYKKMGEFAIKYLYEYDFVLVHVNAADEEGHQRNFLGKKEAIESIDRLIIAPLLSHLHNFYASDFKIMVCGDHSTRCSDGKHTDDLVPFAMYSDVYGNNADVSTARRFNEKESRISPPQKSLEILEYFLGTHQ